MGEAYDIAMFGSHLSIAGGLHNALLKAEEYGMECVQVFTKNQQQWRVPPLLNGTVSLWLKNLRRLGFRKTASHASYLINLASPDPELWRMSFELFVEEIRRCDVLRIPCLVIHPGAHSGAGDEAGIARVAEAIDRMHDRLPESRTITCLEGTAGQGSSIGHRLEHLSEIRKRVGQSRRVGYCLDTAHLWAAGYDFRGRRFGRFLLELDRILGLSRIKVLHMNDSKRELGSRVDRHDHIGHGKIGLAGFGPWVRSDVFANVPKILETPKEKDVQGRDWDEVNLATLRGLA